MKKKILLIAFSAIIIASMAVGATLAYFTAADTATNTFTVGNIDIDLTETNWSWEKDYQTGETAVAEDSKEDWGIKTAQNVMPGTIVLKNPQITNTGDNAAFVRLKITLDVTGFTAEEVSSLQQLITDEKIIFNRTISADGDKWVRAAAPAVVDNMLTVYYNYKTTLAKGAATEALFDSITFATKLKNADWTLINKLLDTADSTFDLVIDAQAIQADNLTYETAFAALDAELTD